MIRRRVAQTVLDATLAVPQKGVPSRGLLRGLHVLRDLLASTGDPLVSYEHEGWRILVPISHDLPRTRKALPDYSGNVARVARAAADKYADLTIVDIGANVGDTVAILRRRVGAPILAVEGSDRYFAVLSHNTRLVGGEIELEHAFVDTGEAITGYLDESKGSGRLVSDREGGDVTTVDLAEVLRRHPRFARPKLIKIDTDGFDCRIIRSGIEVIAALEPILFFEYDPYWLARIGDPGLDVFSTLREVGYEWAIFFESLGEYLVSVRLDDETALEDLDVAFRGRNGLRYADVCAFHRADEDVWRSVRRVELDLANQARAPL